MNKVWDGRGSYISPCPYRLPFQSNLGRTSGEQIYSNSLSRRSTLFESLWIHLNADEGIVNIAGDFLHSWTHCYLVTKIVVTDDQYLLEPHSVHFIKLSGKLITSLISMEYSNICLRQELSLNLLRYSFFSNSCKISKYWIYCFYRKILK